MKTVTFESYISPALTINKAEKPICGNFIQWGNSYILENNIKIPLTVAIVRSRSGGLFLANPVGLHFHDN
ncbi:hypothetical protein [Foetidibacter luteolus]|uniref:hypothetical protein n=1 Tax=Foetidibacter luteolus TaxID=2608880 RepID=UPI00129AFE23|nr:hypothetical protein [Foetidibacter luteolus]